MIGSRTRAAPAVVIGSRTRAAPAVVIGSRTRAALAVVAVVVAGCGSSDSRTQARPALPTGETTRETTELGPVTATVAITPAKVRLGDPLMLELEVAAAPGVQVEMPSFGEALGRFQVVEFSERQSTRAPDSAGDAPEKRIYSQRYILQPAMSGRERIPPLRIEFTDPPAAGAPGETRELLTEEVAIEVESVLPGGEALASLRPARGRLSATRTGSLLASPWVWLGFGLLAIAVAAVLVRRWRAARRERVRVSAYDAAIARLRALERRGLPGEGEADAWYVDLSAIIRRYLEDRFGLRAPELTTEEFLREARRSGRLSEPHRELLSSFLAGCDRVKFARYEPAADESRGALDSARRFLEDTRQSHDADGGDDRTGASRSDVRDPDAAAATAAHAEPATGPAPDDEEEAA